MYFLFPDPQACNVGLDPEVLAKEIQPKSRNSIQEIVFWEAWGSQRK
jgi:hypothetical protein